jgi:hypothetical protein
VEVSGPEIGSELHQMDVVQLVNRFQLQYDLPRNQEVNTSVPNRYTLETDINWELRFEGYGSMGE